MKVTEARVTHVANKGNLKAFASVCLDNEFVVDGFRVVEKDDKLMVFMPEKAKKTAEGEYVRRNTAYPTNTELRNHIREAIVEKYSQG